MNTLAFRLRALRDDAELSARALCDLADLSHAMVTRLENEDRPRPSGTTIANICRVLGASNEYLLFGAGNPPTPTEVRAAVERARTERAAAAPADVTVDRSADFDQTGAGH